MGRSIFGAFDAFVANMDAQADHSELSKKVDDFPVPQPILLLSWENLFFFLFHDDFFNYVLCRLQKQFSAPFR